MSNEYDQNIARHYAAYRPPLHALILAKSLSGQQFEQGLDVGSGTGQSALALAQYCTKVLGIEPSKDMRSRATPHPRIDYLALNNQRWPVPDHVFDIITFAGSLYYAKSQSVVDEISRVAKIDAFVLVYDFEIHLDPVLSALGIPLAISDYEHEIDFSGLKTDRLSKVDKRKEAYILKLTSASLGHLLLSDQSVYHALAQRFEKENLHASIVKKINHSAKRGGHQISAELFYTIYRLR